MSTITLLEDFAATRRCNFCKSTKITLTTWQHSGPRNQIQCQIRTAILNLCFHGCQNFPEPFEDAGCSVRTHWFRIDKYQGIKRAQLRIRRSPHDGPRGGMEKELQLMAKDHEQA